MILNDKYQSRRLLFYIITVLIIVIYLIRLICIQFSSDVRREAEKLAYARITDYAPRGLLYDRNGKLLVSNQLTFDLMVTMNELDRLTRNPDLEPFDTLEFCKLLEITKEQFIERAEAVKRVSGYSPYTPQRFMQQLNASDQAPLVEKLKMFPGFEFQQRTLRHYEYPYAAHVLGSIGEVNQTDLERDTSYRAGDYIGKSGIERTYEKELRGKNGERIFLKNVHGRLQGSYKNGELDQLPVAGVDITTTLDIDLQGVAEHLLRGKIGSIVAIEPSTGEVLAMASSPTWDPSLLIGRQRSIYYPQLETDKTKPLLNRATNGSYPPGSTFKIVQSLVSQQGDAITPSTLFSCSGPGSAPIKCTHHHGSPVNLLSAIEQSCNPYFWQAYRQMLEKDGYGEKNAKFRKRYAYWRELVMSFGLGQNFEDSDIPTGRRGSIPDTTLYDKFYGKTGWRAITIRSNSIGQGEVEVTPLQLANVAAIVANGGYYITPHVNKADSMLTHYHKTAVDEKYFAVVKEGMRRVCTYGTGRHYKIEGVEMAGKTGTADNSKNRPHSVFIAFAPYDNPKIAIAVIIENSGSGATYALPIATVCIEQYLKGEVISKDLYQRMSNTITNPNVK